MKTRPPLAETQVAAFTPSTAQLAFPLGGLARKKRMSASEVQVEGIVVKYLPKDWVSLQLCDSERCLYVHVSHLVQLPSPNPTQLVNQPTTAETVSLSTASPTQESQLSPNIAQGLAASADCGNIEQRFPIGAKVRRKDGRSEGIVARHCPGQIVVFRVNGAGDCDIGHVSKLILIE